jgi:hypothetical protein
MEPNYSIDNFITSLAAFLAYFFGIIVRKIALPGSNSPQLHQQLLLGIPVSLIVVVPFISILRSADLSAFLVTIGIIIEHGMLVNETATYQLQRLGSGLR